MKRFLVKVGDITEYPAQAVVNPITEDLKSAGSVSEKIFSKAGEELHRALGRYESCVPGGVLITDGYDLPAQKILHTVNPMWYGGDRGESGQLAACYSSCLQKAVEEKIKTIAFPSISTGQYHFPVNIAARVAVQTIGDFLKQDDQLEEVTIVCLDERTTLVYEMCSAQYIK